MQNQSPLRHRSSPSPSRAAHLQPYYEQSENTQELQTRIMHLTTEHEHDRNILISLNEKLIVFNDFKQDVENHKAMLRNSESDREKLQMQIRTISQKTMMDSEQHTAERQGLIEENSRLRQALQAIQEEKALTHQQHLEDLNRLNKDHSAQLHAHTQDVARLNQQSTERHSQLVRQQQQSDAQYKRDMQQRAQLSAQIEEQYQEEMSAKGE